jgi:lipopolysaccharide transport system permease protein
MFVLLRVIWDYRHFILRSVLNDYKLRFSRSKIGAFWGILNPLAQVAIYALILSNVLQARIGAVDHPLSFALYLSAGMACWSLFNDIILRSVQIFVANGNLIKKAPFPKVLLVANTIGACCLDNLLLLLSVSALFVFAGQIPELKVIVWLPVLITLTCLLAAGIGLMLGVLNVFFRDVSQVTPIALQIAFWFTPIVYPLSIIPESARNLLAFNPLFPLIEAYQNILLLGGDTHVIPLVMTTLVSITILVLAGLLYTRTSDQMADVL